MIFLKENVSVKPINMYNEYIPKYSLEATSKSLHELSEMLFPSLQVSELTYTLSFRIWIVKFQKFHPERCMKFDYFRA